MDLKCLRCDVKLQDLGELDWRTRPDQGIFELILPRQNCLLAACPKCKELSFFTGPSPLHDKTLAAEGNLSAAELISRYGSFRGHPLYAEFLKSDASIPYLTPQEQESRFLPWLRSQY